MKPRTTLTDKQYFRVAILHILGHGRSKAITGKELAMMLQEPNDRRIRMVIRDLIHDGIPIASAVSGSPKGYFIVETEAESKEYVAVMTARINEDAQRLRDFQTAAKLTGARPGQLALIRN